MKANRLNSIIAAGFSVVLFSCENGVFGPKGDINDSSKPQGNLSVAITDAPIDQAEVTGAFVTITSVKVDGQVLSGFKGPQTVNLLALQNGNSLNLGTQSVAADQYSKLTLEISSETDANGVAPGSYITFTNGTKEKLELSGNGKIEIELKPKNFEVTESGNTEIIVDFDLRKSIKSKNNDFSFVTLGELKSGVRAEVKAKTGTLKGKIDNYGAIGSKVIVYAYQKGSFNGNSEINGQGSSDIKFANAVSSAVVDGGGNFTLAFLPAGEYEIYVEKPQSTGLGLGINTLLELTSNSNLKALAVNANAQTNVSLSVKLGGVLGF